MTLEEAQSIAKICSTADHNCEYCVRALWEQLAKQFPEFMWTLLTTTHGETQINVFEKSDLSV